MVCTNTTVPRCRDALEDCDNFGTLDECMYEKLGTPQYNACIPHDDDDPCFKATEHCWHLIDVESSFFYCMKEKASQFRKGISIGEKVASTQVLAHQNILYLMGDSLLGWEKMYNFSTYDYEPYALATMDEPKVLEVKDEESS